VQNIITTESVLIVKFLLYKLNVIFHSELVVVELKGGDGVIVVALLSVIAVK